MRCVIMDGYFLVQARTESGEFSKAKSLIPFYAVDMVTKEKGENVFSIKFRGESESRFFRVLNGLAEFRKWTSRFGMN
jgi:hypothetical protein